MCRPTVGGMRSFNYAGWSYFDDKLFFLSFMLLNMLHTFHSLLFSQWFFLPFYFLVLAILFEFLCSLHLLSQWKSLIMQNISTYYAGRCSCKTKRSEDDISNTELAQDFFTLNFFQDSLGIGRYARKLKINK